MITAPFNNIIVTIKSRWVKHVSDIAKISSIEQGSSVELADLVSIVGEVVSVPRITLKKLRQFEGFTLDNIIAGDVAIFSHDVVSNFKQIRPDEEPIHTNEFWHNGQTYWTVRIDNLYGVIRDEKIIMLNGFVMVTIPEESRIILSNTQRKKKSAAQSEIINIGQGKQGLPPMKAQVGDTVFYSPNVLRKYQIGDKKFGILTQKQILGYTSKRA